MHAHTLSTNNLYFISDLHVPKSYKLLIMSNLDSPLSPLFFSFPRELEYAYKDSWLRVGISQSNMSGALLH